VNVLGAATLMVAENRDRTDIAVVNSSVQTVYLGKDATVTTLNGFPLPSNMGISFDAYTGPVYGIVGAGGSICGVIEI
jgi:hypothetical protein